MPYGRSSQKYKIPTIVLGDVIDPSEELRAANILDTQLFGAVYAHSGGSGVLLEGSYTSSFSSNDSTVTLSESKPNPAIRAFIAGIYVNSVNPIVWEEIPNNTTVYLYIRLVETETKSSREDGDVIAYWKTTGIAPSDGLLVATAVTSASAITVNSTPTDKVYIKTVQMHIDDIDDPHGGTLFQTNLTVSGLTIYESFTVQNFTIFGTLAVSGTPVFSQPITTDDLHVQQDLTVSGTAIFNGQVNFNTDLVFDGAVFGTLEISDTLVVIGSTEVQQNISMANTRTIDGRDVSADGSTLDSHIFNTSNPHLVSAIQANGLPITGGHMTGNITMGSGLSIDGIDPSTLQPLIDGSVIDPSDELHTHTSGIDITDHNLLSGLGADDHTQYLLAAGGRLLIGNLPFASGVAIDGIDPSTLQRFIDGSVIKETDAYTHTHSGLDPQIGYINLAPEFAGAVLSGAGTGTMQFSYDGEHTYARWESSQGISPYAIVARIGVPADFAIWDAEEPLKVWNKIETNAAGAGLNLEVKDTEGTVVSPFSEGPHRNLGWTETVLSGLSGTYQRGEFFTIIASLTGNAADGDVYLGEITMKYSTRN